MGVVEQLSSNGVPTDSEAGTPSPLPAERSADGLDDDRAGAGARARRRLRGRPARRRARARPPAHARPRLDPPGAGSGGRGGRPLPPGRRAPGRAGARRRRARSRGSGSRAACSRARTSSPSCACSAIRPPGPRRPAAGGGDRAARRRALPCPPRQGDRAPAGAVARRRRQPARHRQSRARRRAPRGAAGAAAAPPPARLAAPRTRHQRGPVRRLGHRARRPLRHSRCAATRASRPAGIVHDESGSAGTLFVEPTEAIELGNALREAEVEEERETLRVLRELTGLLRPELPALRGAVEMCVAVDDLVARARYAVAVEGEVPEMRPAPASLRIVNGRHPLLLAGTEPVVPFDLEMDPSERTLLISGPNTGGKTVLLKAVGLASALAQSGIVPPVGPGDAAAGVRRLLRRHRRPAVHLRQSLHLQRARRHAAPGPGRGRRRLAGAARRGGQRHRSGRGRGARGGDSRLAHRARHAHARDHASRRAQGPRDATRRAW